jgi:hypothetical protein
MHVHGLLLRQLLVVLRCTQLLRPVFMLCSSSCAPAASDKHSWHELLLLLLLT